MSTGWRRLAWMLPLLIACTKPAPLRENPQAAQVPEYALALVTLGAPVRLMNNVFLPAPLIFLSSDGRPVPYREADVPVRMDRDRIIFQLQSMKGDRPLIQYEIVQSREGAEGSIHFWSEAPLPNMTLQAQAPPNLLPVRLKPPGPQEQALSVIGPAMYASCDTLYDPRADYAVTIDQPIQYFPSDSAHKEVGMLGILLGSEPARDIRINFKFTPNLLKSRFKLTALPAQAPSTAPADYCVMQPAGKDAPAAPDLDKWVQANLDLPLDSLLGVSAANGLPAMFCARTSGTTTAPAEGAGPGKDWKKKFDKVKDIYGRVLERGEHYNWQHARELLSTTFDDAWSHGIIRRSMAGPLLVGPPLSLEHARMWATLLALSGQGVVVGGDPKSLPAERVELLRAILPPAPVRSADLFVHAQPETWTVMSTREWKYSQQDSRIEPIATVGVFNWSLEPRLVTVHIPEVMPAIKQVGPSRNAGSFAAFDFWRDQLYAVTQDSFDVPMQPASCRVFRILPLPDLRPQLIGAGQHLIQTASDVNHLAWDAAQQSMTGTSHVTAERPFELCVALPTGRETFEVEAAVGGDAGTSAPCRRAGALRFVTLQPTVTGDITWKLNFSKAPQREELPATPVQLEAAQNTRGVLLKWHGDESAAMYNIYRNDAPVGRTCEPEYQDAGALYGQQYSYAVTAIDFAGGESPKSDAVVHRTPVPASTNLSDLVPLVAEQEHLGVRNDASAAGNPMHVAGKRYHRGLGTHSRARLVYFLGGGYKTFTGEVGIDDETQGQGSCAFKILADGQLLFTSEVLKGGSQPQAFSVPVAGKMRLELMVTDGGDSPDNDHADWGNPYLESNLP